MAEEPAKSGCFVQIFDGGNGKVTFHPYPAEEFHAIDHVLDVRIGPNRFTQDHISIHIDDAEMQIQGELDLLATVPWPVSLTSPGIMGWYAWAPFMQCYHGCVSLDHSIEGMLTIDGRSIDFSGGRGYTEKDWGRSFPASWVWFQTNHFGSKGTSLTVSVAIIPWLGGEFLGFIIGLWHERKLYRFASYTGARLEALNITENEANLVVRDKRYQLEMLATRGSKTGIIRAPTRSGMDRHIEETLNATVDMKLGEIDRGHIRPIFSGAGRNAGMEAVGDLNRLWEVWDSRK